MDYHLNRKLVTLQKLPTPAVKKILSQHELIDIARLATLSQRMRKTIEAARPILKSLKVTSSHQALTLVFNDDEEDRFEFMVVPSREYKETLDANQMLEEHEHVNYKLLGYACSNKEEAGFLLADRFLDFFYCRDITVNLDKSRLDSILPYTNWRKLEKAESLEFSVNGRITQQEVTSMMTNANPTNSLYVTLTGCQDIDYFVDRDFNMNSLVLAGNTKWFGGDLLMRSQCERIRVMGSVLTQSDLNQFIRSWLRGEYNKFTTLIVTVPVITEDKGELIKGLPVIDFADVQRIKKLENQMVQFQHFIPDFWFTVPSGFTMKRADGKWATVHRADLPSRDDPMSVLQFRVWTEEYLVITPIQQ